MEKKKENLRTRVRISGKINGPLGLLNLHRADSGEGGRTYKERSQDGASLFWGRSALPPWGCTFLCLPNTTLSCNHATTLVHCFKSLLQGDRTEGIKLRTYLVLWPGCNMVETPSAWPQRGRDQAQQRPTWQKLMLWELKTKETQHSGSQKKPTVLETGIAKTNSAGSSHGSISDSRRPPVKVGGPHPYGWKD